LALPQHVLRFWETRFPQIKPMKRAGGRRYYRPEDVEALRAIKGRLYDQGYTIKGVQKLIRSQGLSALRDGADSAAPLFDGHAAGAPVAAAPGQGQRADPPHRSAPARADVVPALRAALAELNEARRVLALAAAN